MAPPRIQPLNLKVLSTVHENFKHPIENLFSISNGDDANVLAGYNETTRLVQKFLNDAIQKNKTVRFLGGNWSWTTVGFTKHWMISTVKLNRIKRVLPEETHVSFGSFDSDQLIFAQCGCSVLELNRVLRTLGRSLKTSGASNGQTIAGLVSNNTHGSAIDVGSATEMVVGLHLVLNGNKHVYIERASRPAVSDIFIEKIGAELVRDDAIFNAALVSFGSFGFIHGVMLETEPLFLFNVYRKKIPANTVRSLLQTLDFSATGFLPKPNVRPFHFQAIINPYDVAGGYHITIMYKTRYREHYPRMAPNINKAGPGEDAPILLGRLTSMLPAVTPLIVNQIIKNSYVEINDAWGTHGEIFGSSLARGKVLSTALGISLEHTNTVMDLALQLAKQHGFAGVFACRYVKQTQATLGFTRFASTCVAEFDSFEAPSTWSFYNALWNQLDEAGIPYTFHWGKINNLDAVRMTKMYGSKLDEWIAARNRLMPKDAMRLFTNDFMKSTGLDKEVPPVA